MNAELITDQRYQITVIEPGDSVTVEEQERYGIEVVEQTTLIIKLAGVLQVGSGTGSDSIFVITSSIPLGGHRVATMSGEYADSSNPNHGSQIAGITLQAVAEGQSVQVKHLGELEELSWNWIVGLSVFLGSLGQLTQTPPETGIIVEIGRPITATKLLIDIQPTLYL